jgi:hypothetical protein
VPDYAPSTIALPYRWWRVAGGVTAEVGVNDDPAALGCPEVARGFPYFRARLSPAAQGYGDALGWVQLIEWTPVLGDGGFTIDPFAPLGDSPHPFGFFGFAPTAFDAPHTDLGGEMEFIAHSFLCGLGGELHEMRHEVRAVLGLGWGFRGCPPQLESFGPTALDAKDWDRHRDYLARTFPDWTFAPGFATDR